MFPMWGEMTNSLAGALSCLWAPICFGADGRDKLLIWKNSQIFSSKIGPQHPCAMGLWWNSRVNEAVVMIDPKGMLFDRYPFYICLLSWFMAIRLHWVPQHDRCSFLLNLFSSQTDEMLPSELRVSGLFSRSSLHKNMRDPTGFLCISLLLLSFLINLLQRGRNIICGRCMRWIGARRLIDNFPLLFSLVVACHSFVLLSFWHHLEGCWRPRGEVCSLSSASLFQPPLIHVKHATQICWPGLLPQSHWRSRLTGCPWRWGSFANIQVVHIFHSIQRCHLHL